MFPVGKIHMYVFNLVYILINMLIWSYLEHQKLLLIIFISICFQRLKNNFLEQVFQVEFSC